MFGLITLSINCNLCITELLDDIMMMAVNKYSNLSYDEKPSLFLEFHGSEQHTAEQAQVVGM